MAMLDLSMRDSTSISISDDVGSEPSSNEGEKVNVEAIDALRFCSVGTIVLDGMGVRVTAGSTLPDRGVEGLVRS